MKIGITGGTGLIGKLLVEHAKVRGDSVVIFSRKIDSSPTDSMIEYRHWNPADGSMDRVDDLDLLINLAGSPLAAWPMTKQRKVDIKTSRVRSGETIVEHIQRASVKPKALFQASAIGAYGINENEDLNEESNYGSDYFADVCRHWEASTKAVESMGVRRVVGRIGLVLHPDGGFLPKLIAPFQLYIGGPLGNGEQWYSWIHKDDLARAIFFTLDTPDVTGVVNLTAPNPAKMDDFGRTLAGIIGKPYWLPVPAFALKLVLGDLSPLIIGGQKVLPLRLLASHFNFNYEKLEPALRDILA